MIISDSNIRKIVVQEILKTIYENKDEYNSQEVLEMGNAAVDIIRMLGEKIESEGGRDSAYIDIFDEVIKASLESASSTNTNISGQVESIQLAVDFYNSNINRFPSNIRSSIEELSERFSVFNSPRLMAALPTEDVGELA